MLYFPTLTTCTFIMTWKARFRFGILIVLGVSRRNIAEGTAYPWAQRYTHKKHRDQPGERLMVFNEAVWAENSGVEAAKPWSRRGSVGVRWCILLTTASFPFGKSAVRKESERGS